MVVEIGNTQTTNISFAHFFQYAKHSISPIRVPRYKESVFRVVYVSVNIKMLSANTFTEAKKQTAKFIN